MKRPAITTPISVITDLDIKPWVYYNIEDEIKSVYSILDNTELDKVLELCEEQIVDINFEYIGEVYSTLKKLSMAFGFTLTKENISEIDVIVKKCISENFITALEAQKKANMTKKYANYDANLEVCIAPAWTLEYSLALSPIARLLLESIQEARYKKPYKGKKKEAFDKLIEKLEKGPKDSELAYEIFKPVNDKLVSKAEVAQRLAIKLNAAANDPKIRQALEIQISQDDNLEYLVKAIVHSSTLSKVIEEVEE